MYKRSISHFLYSPVSTGVRPPPSPKHTKLPPNNFNSRPRRLQRRSSHTLNRRKDLTRPTNPQARSPPQPPRRNHHPRLRRPIHPPCHRRDHRSPSSRRRFRHGPSTELLPFCYGLRGHRILLRRSCGPQPHSRYGVQLPRCGGRAGCRL